MIWHRRSVRNYTSQPVDAATLERIKAFMADMKPLYPQIKVQADIVDKDSVRSLMPWVTPQLVCICSEEKEGYLENVGFLFQQLDLYLQAMGLGSCWIGLGRPNSQGKTQIAQAPGMKFVILLAFGHPGDVALRNGAADFNRRQLSQICDQPDDRLEPARLAPSSVNSQPWYFTHGQNCFHVYCTPQGIYRARLSKALSDMNRIDVGIALAHLYVTNPDTFRYFQAYDAPEIKDGAYIGSFTLS